MKPQVDRSIEKVYINLLKKELEHPENWEWINGNSYFASPYINKETKTRFVSNAVNMKDRFPLSMNIYLSGSEVHTLYFKWWNFSIIKKILLLKEYFVNKEENDLFQQKSEMLKNMLGTEIERSLKLSKIRKNM
jgi:hypothetical protein